MTLKNAIVTSGPASRSVLIDRFWSCLVVVLAVALSCLSGFAAAQQQARNVDESSISVSLSSSGSGYGFEVSLRIFGPAISTDDVVRVDWLQGTQTLASQRCVVNQIPDGDPNMGFVSNCDSSQTGLTASGQVQAKLVYIDHVTDAELPLRTLSLRVGRFWDWDGTENGRPHHTGKWQIIGDDLLTAATLELRDHNSLQFNFWAARRQDRLGFTSTMLRCNVNGVRVADLAAPVESTTQIEATDRQFRNGQPPSDETRYQWTRYRAMPELWHGPRTSSGPQEGTFIDEHPGAWVCELRGDGAMVREFHFTVNADGHVAPHAEQTGAGAIWLPANITLLDVRFPNPNAFDFSFQPDVLRAHGFWGRTWVHADAMHEELAALPPAVGTSEPPAPADGAPARVATTAHPAAGRAAHHR